MPHRRALPVNALGMALRAPATRIGAVVNGGWAVTVDTALRLVRCFGTNREFWVNLQPMHDLPKARRKAM